MVNISFFRLVGRPDHCGKLCFYLRLGLFGPTEVEGKCVCVCVMKKKTSSTGGVTDCDKS